MNEFNFKKQEVRIFNWVANRFEKFALYANRFLKENNYVN